MLKRWSPAVEYYRTSLRRTLVLQYVLQQVAPGISMRISANTHNWFANIITNNL